MTKFLKAEELLREFKGDAYIHGVGVIDQVGPAVSGLGRRAVLVADAFPGSARFIQQIHQSLKAAGVEEAGEIKGAHPNAPQEDLYRIAGEIAALNPDVLISFGGGSTIDAVKSGEVLWKLGGKIDQYFGTELVSKALQESGKALPAHVAIQSASSSAAHLTKYSNITDVSTGQKKLVVDPAIVPPQPIFDYEVTFGAPPALTADGALDGISHSLEVLYSAVGKPEYIQVERVAIEAIRLVVNYLPIVLANPANAEGRQALGLATDLGGYAIMLGGTNGAHLTSFSLVDILSHGRACGLMNPYYTVFFAPAVQTPLRAVGKIYQEAGHTQANLDQLEGRALGEAVARAMIQFEEHVGFPAKLSQVPGFSDGHITRALSAAKDPQLKMKLENMPVPLTAETVDEFMGPILLAAKTGDLSLIKTL
jgi:alcohol dehydrogenase class IV